MKKVLSILLAALMIFGLTVNAFAVQLETPPQYPETSEGVDVVLVDDEIQVIINEGATGDLNVNLGDASIKQENAVPGDWTDFPITIINNSSKNYAYQDGSILLGTAPYTPEESEYYDTVKAFDQLMYISSMQQRMNLREITYAVPVTTPLPLWILTSVMAAYLKWTRPYPTLPSAPPSAKQATAAKT